MRSHLLTPAFDINTAAVAAAAHAYADHAILPRNVPLFGVDLDLEPQMTWTEAFDRSYARHLDIAQGQRATELWRIERAAEEVRRQALSARERRILELRDAAHLAPFIDCTEEAFAARDAAERELVKMGAGR